MRKRGVSPTHDAPRVPHEDEMPLLHMQLPLPSSWGLHCSKKHRGSYGKAPQNLKLTGKLQTLQTAGGFVCVAQQNIFPAAVLAGATQIPRV